MFMGLLGNAAVVIGLGALIRVFGKSERPLRPPGAVAEQAFLAECIKCQRCAEVCPTGVITQCILTENLIGFGTPRVSFQLGYCTLCLKCVQVCPTGALLVGSTQNVVLGIAEINTRNCIAWTWGGCTKCQQVCSKGAVTLDRAERPVVEPSRCNGCGECEFECPSSALRSGSETSGRGIMVVPLNGERTRLSRKIPSRSFHPQLQGA